MRKIRPQDVKNNFASFVSEHLHHFDRVEDALRGSAHEKRDMSLLSETTLHSTYVAFECFISDLLLAYMNRDFSQYQSDIQQRMQTSIQSKFGNWAAGRYSFATVKHIKADELETILDPDSYNLTFKDVATLKQRCTDWLAAPHRNAIVQLNDADSKLIDTTHSIRNFIAHRSRNAKTIMNQRLASIVIGAGCPNTNLARGAHDIHDIGVFLKSSIAGTRRVKIFVSRLAAIAATL